MAAQTDSNILIIGAGTWGCSVALKLTRCGHTNIKVLGGSSFPSAISAGNDLNKIGEEANEPSQYDPMMTTSGIVDNAYQRCVEYAEGEDVQLVALKTKEDFQKTMPEGVLQGDFPGWQGFWKQAGAGWVFASGTLKAMHAGAVELRVQLVTGDREGRVETLLYSNSKAVVGARTADGNQLRPTARALAHIPLSEKEAALYKNLPVLYGVDRDFFIEPDAAKHRMKLCDEHPGYIDPVIENGKFCSVPFARHQIPVEAEARMRLLLRETMSQLAEREFSFARMCWDADTVDRRFLIDKHSDIENLIVAVGGSGNEFMICPAIGVLVADILEPKGEIEERIKMMLRWRPETAVGRDWWHSQGRYGADGKVMDLRDVKEWTKTGLSRSSTGPE
ncbi:fructosyl-amino acid oxidase [Didymella exigua CBS 183.55]|uniref:Fructosyl-amino acid oxidase n=1 Tax=Didymella exigua CBS 183.55 TaxID=1150837 RepID=A0A6A5RNU9_9PLEO|nr:fructosyl-amino acid oxidase [Didymella exigua CBS 183.55]KAF1929103.1 fructosyl-amino acid oxidase [Didymella exigua CBS 183.55]